MQSRRRALAVALAAGILSAKAAHSAGFALKEQSASGLGSAFAGQTAGGEDISAMFTNPAALTRYPGSRVSLLATYIMPQIQFQAGSASTVAGVPIGGGTGGSDVADDVMLPAAYALWDLDEAFGLGHKLRFGVGVNVPFGLETNYNDGWIGRYHALHSKLETLNINPALAVEVAPGLSLGAGAQLQYAEATLSNAIDFGTIGAFGGVPFAVPTRQDGRARITGDDWGYGFTLGALYEPWDGSRIGVGYRSAVKHRLSGRGSFRLDDAGVGATLSAATGAFTNTDAEADLTTPETVNIGLTQELGDRWSLSAEAQWTRWSRFDDLTITFANPAQPSSVTEQDWEDVWFFALGLTWRPSEAWALRAGYAYDQSPIPNRTATPRIPDGDRHWLAIGASYRPAPAVLLAAGYTHIFLREGHIDLSAGGPGDTFRGDLRGRTRSSIDMVALQAEWQF